MNPEVAKAIKRCDLCDAGAGLYCLPSNKWWCAECIYNELVETRAALEQHRAAYRDAFGLKPPGETADKENDELPAPS